MALQLADMFVSSSDGPTASEQHNFDFIIKHVTRNVSTDITARVAERVARTNRIASDTATFLAKHENVEVAQPVLKHSPMLSDDTLIEIAKTGAEGHRVAIAGRQEVTEVVTEVLSEVGGERTLNTLANNMGARFNSRGLANMVERAAPGSAVPRKLAERAKADSKMAGMVKKSLSRELRSQLEAHGLNLADTSFDEIARETKAEVDRQVKAERLNMVDAMVARTKIANGQANLDQLIAQALDKNAFLLATRILSMQSDVAYNAFLQAMKEERAEPLAILCRAESVKFETYQRFEVMRCEYFGHDAGDLNEKIGAMRRVTEEQAKGFLTKIRETLAA
ncbi:MAG: DUF2336 domain-containing protein [Pseudomonadota bacterium]